MRVITVIINILLLLMIGTTTSVAKSPRKVNHVILIGLDGWGAYSMKKAEMPNVRKLMEQGMYTFEKRSVLPSSSAVNWASMFMGAGPELHGYTQWGSRIPELPSRIIYKNNIFPTIFQLLRNARPHAEIGCLYEWEGIKYLVDTLSLSYHAKALDYSKNSEMLCQMAEEYIVQKHPNLLAICFDNPDHVGHAHGHDTPFYYEKLKELDMYIGRILTSIEKAGMMDDSIIIITADHGGVKHGHGGKTMEEMQTPFIISGKGIRQDGVFHESMMQFDIAATIAYIFNLKQPQVWIGRPMKQIFK